MIDPHVPSLLFFTVCIILHFSSQEKQEEKNISGTITKIIQTVVDGNSHFYITIDSLDAIFDVNVIENPEIIKYNVGDVIKMSYTENDKTNDAKPVK